MSLSNSQSFIEPHVSSSEADIDSLPSSSTSSSVDEEEYVSDAEREWRESLQQMELLLTMVMVPYIGKYFGRKFAYYGISYINSHEDDCSADSSQAGQNSWNGNIPSRSSSRIRQRSRRQEPSRQQQHYSISKHFGFTATALKAHAHSVQHLRDHHQALLYIHHQSQHLRHQSRFDSQVEVMYTNSPDSQSEQANNPFDNDLQNQSSVEHRVDGQKLRYRSRWPTNVDADGEVVFGFFAVS